MSENDKCPNIATVRRFWPGEEPDCVCAAHAEDSKRIADAMGFYLPLQPLDHDDQTLTCCCSKGFSQTVVLEN